MKICSSCYIEIPIAVQTCPHCAAAQDPAPFVKLKHTRQVSNEWIPQDLATFYSMHEGSGMGATDASIRIARLGEVEHLVGSELVKGGRWAKNMATFEGILMGAGYYGDEIVYVLQSEVAPRGAIIAFGCDVAGPGGVGPEPLGGALVLASDFGSWLARLQGDSWNEYGLTPGELGNLPANRAEQLRRHFRDLNPEADWCN